MRSPCHWPVRLFAAAFGAALFAGAPAVAQGAPSQPPDDPVVAKVDGRPIHLSDLKDAASPAAEHAWHAAADIYPMLLDQLIDGRALVYEAHKIGPRQGPDACSARWQLPRTGRCRPPC